MAAAAEHALLRAHAPVLVAGLQRGARVYGVEAPLNWHRGRGKSFQLTLFFLRFRRGNDGKASMVSQSEDDAVEYQSIKGRLSFHHPVNL